MTEADAKTKWCPMTRLMASTDEHYAMTSRGHVLKNDDDYTADVWNCLGPACMAWRAQPQGGVVWRLTADGKRSYSFAATELAAFADRSEFEVEANPPSGFCGLAGAPQ